MKSKKVIFILLISILLTPNVFAEEEKDDFIKWVDFDVSYKAMSQALEADINSHDGETPLDWVEMLSYLGAKYGGDFSKFKSSDLENLIEELTNGTTIDDLTKDMEYYNYYHEVYSAVLGEFVGEYKVQAPNESDLKDENSTEGETSPYKSTESESAKAKPENLVWEERYGLKVFSPVAKGFYYEDYDDFGSSRDYGYRRKHLGHDMFGLVGTPIIAIESGTIEVLGWNQYGGWRIGIRSFDGLRYYYYAHLRQNRPFHCDIEEGCTVKAGDVIGYMGHTGYSTKENTNNIKETHLHLGMQLIFDEESQKEGSGEIWIDLYSITELLRKNTCETYRVAETKEFYRKYDFEEPSLENFNNAE